MGDRSLLRRNPLFKVDVAEKGNATKPRGGSSLADCKPRAAEGAH